MATRTVQATRKQRKGLHRGAKRRVNGRKRVTDLSSHQVTKERGLG